MEYETLNVESTAGVTRVTLNCPARLNALSRQMLRELYRAFSVAAADEACRCVLLSGAGPAFCAGADLADPEASESDHLNLGAIIEEYYDPLLSLMREMPKPLIAAVHGSAAGAGCSLALAADITLADREARFIQSFIRIGLVPDAGGTWIIPQLIGRARALRWMMTGESLSATTAETWGLIAGVYENAELLPAAQKMAERLAAAPTRSLARIKQLIDRSGQNDLQAQLSLKREAQTAAGRDQDFIEGVTAFAEGRQPHFLGL